MSKKSPQPSRPPDKRPEKDKPPFPGPRKSDKPRKPKNSADPYGLLTERDREAARRLGTPENLPLTPHAKSVLQMLRDSSEHELAA